MRENALELCERVEWRFGKGNIEKLTEREREKEMERERVEREEEEKWRERENDIGVYL